MNKPESLREHLMAAVPELRHNPDRLLVFIDNGSLRSTAAPGLSFEYSYTLNLILTDFAGHPDAVAIPLFAWVLVNQRELMENIERGRDAIKFEADILSNKAVDLSITLPLTERVIVKRQADGTLQVSHPAEPVVDDETFLVPAMRVETSEGELLAEWGNNG
ncbi:phage tail protein [Stutzerimonas stutzeri]|uniref:Tail protein n=1 Tax=Stutzerimonas stutzeri KOS6 TaxID=1218352 RepID=A0A061JKL4_STUST|nr:phage tail protein [Stutzerimonas stutzeri]EWC40207.1 tail protein [Stutzerimonas stutzeri KOS6]